MKRIFALLLSLAVLFSCLAVTAGAMYDPSTVYDVKAQSAYIVNTDTNIIVYEKDSEKQVSAGGLTKYMTIALVLTNYADQLDNTFTMPFAISDYVHNSDNADMRSGETFTYREALYAMVTRNANEAAMGLAYELSGGDLAGWVSQMNTLSQRIGTTNSTWTDACGLDSGNTTTAVDMYLILRYLMSFDAFKEISSAPTFTMPAKEKHAKSFVLLSQNVALNKTSGGRFYRSAMQGGMCDVMAYKNDSGDQSYVSWANKDGATYIFCIMQSPDTCDDYGYSNRRPALYETTKLIDWVFESFSIQAALDTDQALAEFVQDAFMADTLRVYTSPDPVGAELGAALKNVIALCAGITDGLGFGDNAKAMLMTRGLTETARLGVALGAKKETFAGLAGVGDLIVTCTSMHSRNRRAGILIGQGKDPQAAMKEVGAVVEGYYAAKSAYELGKAKGIDMPITDAAYKVLYEGADVKDAVQALLSRQRKSESEDAGWQ